MNEQGTTDPQTGLDKVFTALRGIGIRRRTDDKWIAGVCSGLAERLGVDPVIIRAGLILLSLLGGAGITIYLVAWALLPNERGEIAAERALRGGDTGSIVLVVFAAIALCGGSMFAGSWWGDNSDWGFPWGLALTGLLVWWLVRRSGTRPGADQRMRTQQFGTPTSYDPSSPGTGPSPTGYSPPSPGTGSAPTAAWPAASGPPSPGTGSAPAAAWQTPSWQTASWPAPPGGASAPARPAAPTRPVVPKRPRRRSGGPLMGLVAIGMALSTYGSLIWAGQAFGWTGDHEAIALAGSLASIGLLLVVLGLAGWRAGFVAFMAVILAVSAWTTAVIPSGIHFGGRVGDAVWAPTSVAAGAGANYQLGVGDGVLDLSGLPTSGLGKATAPPTTPDPTATSSPAAPARPAAPALPSGTVPPTLPAYVGIGELTVIVPEDLTVKFMGHVSLGEIQLPDDTGSNHEGGSDVSRTVVIGEGPTEVVVNAGVGIGQITVVKE